MAPSTARRAQPEPDTSDTSVVKPQWDTSPNSFPLYYQALLKWLERQESRFTLLVQQYVVLNRGALCCMSDNHLQRVSQGLIAKGTFANPVRVLRGDLVMVPPSVPPASPAPAPAPASAPTSSSAPSSSAIISSPSTADTTHVIKPHVVEEADQDLFNIIAETVCDEDTVDEWVESIGSRSGVALLIIFRNKSANSANELSTTYADAILQQMADLEEVGLTSALVSEFNTYKTNLNRLRKLLPGFYPTPFSKLCNF